jgi:hypothetical protein
MTMIIIINIIDYYYYIIINIINIDLWRNGGVGSSKMCFGCAGSSDNVFRWCRP